MTGSPRIELGSASAIAAVNEEMTKQTTRRWDRRVLRDLRAAVAEHGSTPATEEALREITSRWRVEPL